MITKPVVGDIVKSNRFRFGEKRHDGRILVGCQQSISNATDRSRAEARFLVVHVYTEVVGGPNNTTEITALRINEEGMTLGEEIVFEVERVCHEHIMPEQITSDGHYDKVPFFPNAALIVKAGSKDAAKALVVNLNGFFAMEEPVEHGSGTWKIVGHSYRETEKDDAIVGVCELVTADSSQPVDIK